MANSNEVSITNSTSAPVAMLDAYDPSPTATGNQAYGQPLTLRPTDAGSQTIAAGTTVTLPLDPARTVYDLIFARPADLFPIQNSSLMLDLTSQTYPPLTVAATASAQLTLALQFYINLLVYPTSKMAIQYQSVLSNAVQQGTSSTDIETAVNNFFQSTTQYQSLTLDAVVAAQTYAQSFAYVWAGFTSGFTSFNNSITYYLYAPGTPPAESNQATPTALGTLVLQKKSSPPNPADPADRAGAYQITYTAPDGTITNMFYSGGQFVSDTTSNLPAIAFQGTFGLKSSLTNQASDNVIIPLLIGQVNGVQAVGTTSKQDSSEQGWFYTFFHPTTFSGWLALMGATLGLALGLGLLVLRCRGRVNFFRIHNAPPPQNEIEVIDQQDEQALIGQQQSLNRLGNEQAQVPSQDEWPAMQDAVSQRAGNVNNLARADSQLDSLWAQKQQVEVVTQFEVNGSFDPVANEIRDGIENLNAAILNAAIKPDVRSSELADAVNEGAQNVSDIQTKVDNWVKAESGKISEQSIAYIEQAREAVVQAQQVDENAKESVEMKQEGEDAPIIGEI